MTPSVKLTGMAKQDVPGPQGWMDQELSWLQVWVSPAMQAAWPGLHFDSGVSLEKRRFRRLA